jgi:hypothetical protein
MIGSESMYADALLPSLEEAINLGINTQNQVCMRHLSHCEAAELIPGAQALDFIGTRIRKYRQFPTKKTKVEEARELMASVVLSHIPVIKFNFRHKCLFLALMVRKVRSL